MAKNRLEPSSKQIEVLRCIHMYWKQHRIRPTIREIGESTGIDSTSVVSYQLMRLEQLGCIVRRTRASRAIVLTEKASRYLDTDAAPTDDIMSIPEYILEELLRLRSENARFKGLKLNETVIEQMHAQRTQVEQKYRERIRNLELERDRLIDDLVRLQMRSAS
jgi:SOS-response transcriptional repressor LexA